MSFSPSALLEELRESSDFNVIHYQHLSSDGAEWGRDITEIGLPDALVTLLHERGINRLFKFQDQALQKILAGHDTVILAPTANGKTEAFLLPILLQLEPTDPNVRALLIYPTNALVNDQFRKIQPLATNIGLQVACFIGDTSREAREQMFRNPPTILLTNIDTIHANLAKSRAKDQFKQLIRSVRFIILDEIHIYKGTFGSHAHMILKRLKRLAEEVPVTIGASATLSNAPTFVTKFFGPKTEIVTCGKPREYSVHVVMVYPQIPYQEAINAIVRKLEEQEVKTLVFANDHRSSEITVRTLRKDDIKAGLHRSGLSIKRRKQLEGAFREGRLKVLVATPTMELGVDIGSLDAIVSPVINLTRTQQRIGRAGREGQESFAAIILRQADAISEFYRRFPEKYFEDREALYFEPHNVIILKDQLLAAAADEPLYEREMEEYLPLLEEMVGEALLQRGEPPARRYSLTLQGRKRLFGYNIRGGTKTAQIIDVNTGEPLGTGREFPMATRELHPGAIYSLEGRSYKSLTFDVEAGEAQVYEIQSQHSTTALYSVHAQLLERGETHKLENLILEHGPVSVTEVVTGYLDRGPDGSIVNQHEITPIEYTFQTEGLIFRFRTLDRIEKQNRMPLLHTLEHLAILSAAQITGGELREFGGFFENGEELILYESTPGGNGLITLLLGRLERFLQRLHLILQECDHRTQNGEACPCVFLYYCGKRNHDLDKSLAREFLTDLLGPLMDRMVGPTEELHPIAEPLRAEILDVLKQGPLILVKKGHSVFAHPPIWQVTSPTAQEEALREFPNDWWEVGQLDESGVFTPTLKPTTPVAPIKEALGLPLPSGKFIAEDGHRVRSRGELLIDNWLYHHGILHVYEKLISRSRAVTMRCDFYLPELDRYIEYWGLETDEYQQRRQEKEQLYQTLGLKLFSVENTDIYDLDAHLSSLLHDQRAAVPSSLPASPHSMSIKETKDARTNERVHLRGKRIIGQMRTMPEAKITSTGRSYVELVVQDATSAAVIQVWGDNSIENVRQALALSEGETVVLDDPILPPTHYRSAEIWIHQSQSKIRKIHRERESGTSVSQNNVGV